jgi:hypothetical protein
VTTPCYQRVGLTRATVHFGPNFYPKTPAWIKKIDPFFYDLLLHEQPLLQGLISLAFRKARPARRNLR